MSLNLNTLSRPAEPLRRVAAGLVDALPAVLLAAALLAPALAAFARDGAPRAADPALGHAIAEQGNRALAQIRAEAREAARHMAPPALPAYAVAQAPLVVAQNR